MANLSGMFEQLNAAVLGNPLAGDAGGKLLSGFSQGMGGALGAAFDTDKYGFMTEDARVSKGKEEVGKLDLNTLSGMQQAANIYSKMGDPEKALKFMNMAEQKKQQLQATLTEGQEDLRKGSARTKAAALAMSRKDRTAHSAITGGYLAPEEYIAGILDEEQKVREHEREEQAKREAEARKGTDGYTLGPGQVRFDASNIEVARGPKKEEGGSGSDKVPVYVERASFESGAAARQHATNAAQADKLIQDIDAAIEAGAGPSGGALATGEEAFRKFVGSPDDVSDLKIRYYRLRNSDAVANLPPGSASDADVQLAMQGWPGDNAPLTQIRSFLRGMSKMEKDAAAYQNFVTDFIGENRTTLGVQKAWRESVAEQTKSVPFNSLPES